jgi:hypothetical protein
MDLSLDFSLDFFWGANGSDEHYGGGATLVRRWTAAALVRRWTAATAGIQAE